MTSLALHSVLKKWVHLELYSSFRWEKTFEITETEDQKTLLVNPTHLGMLPQVYI